MPSSQTRFKSPRQKEVEADSVFSMSTVDVPESVPTPTPDPVAPPKTKRVVKTKVVAPEPSTPIEESPVGEIPEPVIKPAIKKYPAPVKIAAIKNPPAISTPPAPPALPPDSVWSNPFEYGRSNILILLVAGILLVITGILFGYGYGIKQLDGLVSNIQTTFTGKPITKESSPSAKQTTTDPTATWKTYESSKGKFSIKYPDGFAYYENKSVSLVATPSPDAPDTFSLVSPVIAGTKTNYVLSIKFIDIDGSGTLEQQMSNDSWCSSISSGKGAIYTLADRKALIFTDTPCGPVGSTVIYTSNGSILYRFTIESHTGYADVKTNVEHILSTFKFTDQTPSSDATKDWKSYSVAGDIYSFKYPQNWVAKVEDNDYFGHQATITNQSGSVVVRVLTGTQPYGYGQAQDFKTSTLAVTIDGVEHKATERIVNGEDAYVDLKIEKGGKNYQVLFGTGYPVAEEFKATLIDYQNSRDTILQILSTFKFTE